MPARCLRMLIRDEARVIIELIWEEIMKWISKVTPICMQCLLSRVSRDDIFYISYMIFNMAYIFYYICIEFIHKYFSNFCVFLHIFLDLFLYFSNIRIRIFLLAILQMWMSIYMQMLITCGREYSIHH